MKPTSAHSLRHFSRVPFQAEVSLYLHDRRLKVQLLDIAFKGALVHTNAPERLALQEKCRLVLSLAQGDTSIEMEGKITHLEGQNVGIECKEIDMASLTELRRLIELNTGDSALMNRELAQLLLQRSAATTIFSTRNPLALAMLSRGDLAISFILPISECHATHG